METTRILSQTFSTFVERSDFPREKKRKNFVSDIFAVYFCAIFMKIAQKYKAIISETNIFSWELSLSTFVGSLYECRKLASSYIWHQHAILEFYSTWFWSCFSKLILRHQVVKRSASKNCSALKRFSDNITLAFLLTTVIKQNFD